MEMSYDEWVKQTQEDINAGRLCPRCASELVENEDGTKGCTSCEQTFKIVKGKLKINGLENSDKFWQNYLIGKTLTLCSSIMNGGWNLVGIEGEEKCKSFLKWVWEHEPEHDYESIEDMQEEIDLGNDGFGFEAGEIEVLEFLLGYDFEEKKTIKP